MGLHFCFQFSMVQNLQIDRKIKIIVKWNIYYLSFLSDTQKSNMFEKDWNKKPNKLLYPDVDWNRPNSKEVNDWYCVGKPNHHLWYRVLPSSLSDVLLCWASDKKLIYVALFSGYFCFPTSALIRWVSLINIMYFVTYFHHHYSIDQYSYLIKLYFTQVG